MIKIIKIYIAGETCMGQSGCLLFQDSSVAAGLQRSNLLFADQLAATAED